MQFKALAPDRDPNSIEIQECEPSIMCINYTDALTNLKQFLCLVIRVVLVGSSLSEHLTILSLNSPGLYWRLASSSEHFRK